MDREKAENRAALGQLLVRSRQKSDSRAGKTVEQAAEAAGVGIAWYRWLEDGKDIGVSATSLRWVVDALEVTPAARREIFELAGVQEMDDLPVFTEIVPPAFMQTLKELGSLPAYMTGHRGDILAWNEAAEAAFRCYLLPPLQRNMYVFLFGRPEARKLLVNWEEQARCHIRELRQQLERWPKDAILTGLLRHLDTTSPDFHALWHSTLAPATEVKVILSPRVGRMVFEMQHLYSSRDSELQIRVYLPRRRDGTRSRMEKLLRIYRREKSSHNRTEQQNMIQRIRQHLDQCYAREVPLDELAALVDSTKYSVLRKFSSEVGYPPHAYQLLVRIFHARRMLTNGEDAAKVAEAVGFTDQSHMIRQFKRIEGMTPSQYIRLQTVPN